MRLSLRARFALLAALLVLVVASLVALGGYLALRHSLLGQAERQARNQARQLVGLVDIPLAQAGQGQGNRVDITDPALTQELSAPGLIVQINRPGGAPIQASAGRAGGPPPALPGDLLARCLSAGQAQAHLAKPAFALACARVGSRTAAVGTVSVGAPLGDALASLRTLRSALGLGVFGGAALAAALALLVAGRAVRPIRQIAETAETIRSGDLGQRIGYRGRDELGALARVLDACFAELQEALERQRRFGADASHELKTPLAAIRANVEILRRWAATEPAARDAALASLDQASRRAARLVADLLYLATLEREPPRARAPVRLDEVVLNVVREATPLDPDVAIRVTRLDEATVSGDALGLQQLVLNLIDNALHASPPGAEVTVALTAGPDHATVTVSDDGPGIEPDQLERIFDRFYSRPGRSSTPAGTGLGLAIAREIARDHGGELTGYNREQAGAGFELTLPLTPPSSITVVAEPSTAAHTR
jgi:signal transduction histidine kinase